jgi:hypothetical protein
MNITLLHCVIFPVPYGYISTDFDVLCVQQLMLKKDSCNIFLEQHQFSMSSSSHADNGFSN